MKRSPLPRRTPLKAHAPLKARAAGLRHRSVKTAKVYRERRKLVARTLQARPWCEACSKLGRSRSRSTVVHETLTRARGGDILDPRWFMALCAWCHDWIHTHVAEATRLGWLESQYQQREEA